MKKISKNGIYHTIGTSTLMLAYVILPTILHAQSMQWVTALFGEIKRVLQVAVPVLMLLSLAVFIWGVVVFIFKSDDEKARAEGKQRILWGLIGLFVIVSVWGLVVLLSEITGIFGYTGIRPPQTLFRY